MLMIRGGGGMALISKPGEQDAQHCPALASESMIWKRESPADSCRIREVLKLLVAFVRN